LKYKSKDEHKNYGIMASKILIMIGCKSVAKIRINVMIGVV